MSNLTEILAKIEERAEKAEAGPWTSETVTREDGGKIATLVEVNQRPGYSAIADLCGRAHALSVEEWLCVEDTGKFIAAARTDVPALVRALNKCREQRDDALALSYGHRHAFENSTACDSQLARIVEGADT